MSTTLIQGSRLSAMARAQVLAQYVHRWTHENAKQTYGGRCPGCEQATRNGRIVTGGEGYPLREWSRAEWHNYHVPLVSDKQWLADHAFYVRKDGTLDSRQSFAKPAYMAVRAEEQP